MKENIERKEADNERMRRHLIDLTKDITKRELQATCRIAAEYRAETAMQLPGWEEFKVA